MTGRLVELEIRPASLVIFFSLLFLSGKGIVFLKYFRIFPCIFQIGLMNKKTQIIMQLWSLESLRLNWKWIKKWRESESRQESLRFFIRQVYRQSPTQFLRFFIWQVYRQNPTQIINEFIIIQLFCKLSKYIISFKSFFMSNSRAFSQDCSYQIRTK